MSSQKLYGVTALFDTPDEIMEAAAKTAKLNFKKWDVNTPYPVHGMDDAMGLKPSKLPWVTFAFSLFGASFACFFAWWTMADQYPLNIGGKPFFSLPAFVPIMFALGVLISVITTVFSLIAFFCKLPYNNHPLHDTQYMKSTGSDRFGVVVEADNENFDLEMVKSFFQEIGGKDITEQYFPEKKRTHILIPKVGIQIPYSEWMFVLVIVGVLGGVAAKTYVMYNQVLYDRIPMVHVDDPVTGINLSEIIEPHRPSPYTWMDIQSKGNPQRYSLLDSGMSVMREPVKGTVARGFMPYKYKGRPDLAEKNLVSPVLVGAPKGVPVEKDIIEKGQKLYNTYCINCHGRFGDGQGTLRGNYFAPPSFHSEKLKNAGDGLIYHIITEGQGQMASYAKQISREDRWKIVYYIRTLQRAKDAKPSDLE